jgi:MFS family permease
MGFFQPALVHVLGLSVGTLSVGFTLSFYAAAYKSLVPAFKLETDWDRTLFNSLTPIAAIFGSIGAHVSMANWGRKVPCAIASCVVVLGWVLLLVTKPSYSWLGFVSRFVMGLGAGAISTVTPVYIAEISPTEVRGSYGVMSQLATSAAAMIAYFLGIWLGWAPIAGICLGAPAVLLAMIKWIPESPAVARMDRTEAMARESVFQCRFLKSIGIAFLLVAFQQFSGINALGTNLTPIFQASNVKLDPSVSSTIVGSAQVITVAMSTPLVERLGRRVTWMMSSIGQALFLLVLWANEVWISSNILPIVLLFLDVLFFGIGLGPLPWFVVPELFPDGARSGAMGMIQGVNWGLAALMIFVFESMQKAMTLGWVYFFYGVVMICSFVFGLFALPETAGVEMGQAENLSRRNGQSQLKPLI